MAHAVRVVRLVGARRRIVIGTIVIVSRSERVADADVVVCFLRGVGARCGRLIGLLGGSAVTKRVGGLLVEIGGLRFVGARSLDRSYEVYK